LGGSKPTVTAQHFTTCAWWGVVESEPSFAKFLMRVIEFIGEVMWGIMIVIGIKMYEETGDTLYIYAGTALLVAHPQLVRLAELLLIKNCHKNA
jgi:hypothetical protein